jgi:nitroreductase
MKQYILILFSCSLFAFATQCQADEQCLVSPVFMTRHSGKSFKPTSEISSSQLYALIESARWAPSSFNDQPWNFIFCDRNLTPDAYDAALESIVESQQSWVQNAPLIVICVVRPNYAYNGKFNDWADYDAGAAAVSMSLQAEELGLMAHQLGGFDPEKVQLAFHLPEGFKPITITAIGYETEEGDIGARPRTRKPVEDNFFMGAWGNGIPTRDDICPPFEN